MSQFIVSARKYRPQTFDQIIGQKHIAQTLKNALQSNQLAHAFLFNGPRGVGKTTSARVLAKVLNCENVQNHADPCNSCSSCNAFNDSASFNIIELDAASNNSVESIRNLIEQVRFQPQHGKYKVFIIDEVHMLSTAAFNAFLKTLEEPPSYAIFILATTEKHKVIPTILSRCQVFDFKRIQIKDIVSQLASIAKNENIEAAPEALQIIAQKADGSMRDALSIYDKIASTSNGIVSYEQTIENLNVLDFDFFFRITDAALREDLSETLLIFDEVMRKGFDSDLFVQGLAQHLRDILVAQNAQTVSLLEVGEELQKRYLNQAELASKSFLLNALHLLNKCDLELLRTGNKRLSVEIALSKLCYLNQTIQGQNEEKKKPEPISVSSLRPKENLEPSPSITPAKNSFTKVKVQTQDSSELEIKSSEVDIEVKKHKAEEEVTLGGLGNLSKIRDQIKKDTDARKARSKDLSFESFMEYWNEYKDNHISKSTVSAMNHVQIEVDSEIKVYVPTSVTRDIIQQEANLLQILRDGFNRPDLSMSIIIDLDRFPDQEQFLPKKILTNKEKYEEMVKKNPMLSTMTKKFGLKVDNT